MNVMRVALSVSLAWAGIAVLAGLILQVELFMPGVRVFLMDGAPAPYLFAGLSQIHANAVKFALPATLIGAVGCAQLARSHPDGSTLKGGLSFSALALILLGTAVAANNVLQPMRPFGPWASLNWVGASLAGVSIFAGLIACIRTAQARRTSLPWLVFAIAPLCLLAVGVQIFRQDETRYMLHDSYLHIALWHAGGGAACLLTLGLLSVVARAEGKRVDARVSIILAGLIALVWAVMVLQQARAGLEGLPRGYVDYPESFSALQARASLAAFLACGLFLLAVLRLAVAPRRPELDPDASVF
jgi:hypothetical protein